MPIKFNYQQLQKKKGIVLHIKIYVKKCVFVYVCVGVCVSVRKWVFCVFYGCVRAWVCVCVGVSVCVCACTLQYIFVIVYYSLKHKTDTEFISHSQTPVVKYFSLEDMFN